MASAKKFELFQNRGLSRFLIQVLYLLADAPKAQKQITKTWAFSSAGERFPDTEEVTSSNLVTPTICDADMAQLVEHHLAKVRVAGSNPVVRSIVLDELVRKLASS